MMARSSAVAVVGAGSWGTALALQIGRRGTPVRLWARDAALAASIASTHENTRYLPGVTLPDGLLATADHREALRDADLVILAVPSHFVRDTLAPMTADIAPRWPRIRIVSSARHFPSDSVIPIRAHRLWL